MNPVHHLDDATLVAYGAGTLSSGLALTVEAHLELCPQCRKAARMAVEIGAATMDEAVAVSEASKSAVMDKIGSATVHRLPVATHRPNSMPRALQRVLGVDDFDALAWSKAGPGVTMYKLPLAKGERGFFGLLKVSPGAKLPDHGHGGTELTLVLRGAYHDQLGEFAAGDIADLDESVTHTPVASSDEACICLVANEAATRFASWPARLVQKFIGI